ncbi:hypothetical protein Nepgr_019180 [Nepenthes gracilis]|uniref:Uncharacterized protein n=1 Tax=Nepenthes gracilis TaxID=150966 RepID=A0AAD3XUS1_NEPGR|nr:hypothetical protein Nepgr_019180 [Nepenthes gracilis]
MQQLREINFDDHPVDEMEMAPPVASRGRPHQMVLDQQVSIYDKLGDLVDTKTTSKDSTPDDFSSADPIALSEHMSEHKILLGNDPMPSEFKSEYYTHSRSGKRFRSRNEVDDFIHDTECFRSEEAWTKRAELEIPTLEEQSGSLGYYYEACERVRSLCDP